MKLLTPIAAIVTLAAAGHVFHSPAEMYQSIDFQGHQPIYQLQVQHAPQAQEVQTLQHQGFSLHEGGFQGHEIQQNLPQVHQAFQVHQAPQVHQSYQAHQPQKVHETHQVHRAPVHQAPKLQTIHKVHQTPQVHQTHQVHQTFQGHQDHQSSQGHEHGGVERMAKILSYQHDTDGHNYQYAYETDNGIKVQEVGSTAEKGSQSQGAYSYTGDDGHVYTITYTADENGFHAEGAHIPTPPPMPEEIAKSIEMNARDEANGIVDDGHYQPQHHQQSQHQPQSKQQDYQKYGYQHQKTHNFGQPAPISEYEH